MTTISPEAETFLKSIEGALAKQGGEIGTMREQLAQLEQKAARRGGGGAAEETVGAQIARSENLKSYIGHGARGSMRFETKATTSAQAPVYSARDTEISELARRRLTIRDLLTVVPTDSGSVDWSRQVTRVNNAGVVAEAAQKPLSSYTWEQVNTPIRTIAHLSKLTRQALDDSAQLQGEVDFEMRYGLGLAEEVELLNGDGTGAHLTGMIPAATAYSAPIVIDNPTMIDKIGLAILQQSLTEFPTDGIVMHPSDWMGIRLLKDTQGKYIMGDPGEYIEPRLFGQPVVPTTAISADKFLVGGFKLQKLYDRMAPEVVIASENADDFEHNLYTMRCEERVGLAIRKAAALIYGDFGRIP